MTADTPSPPTVGDLLEGALAERLKEGRAEADDASDGEPEAWAALLRETLEQALPRALEAGESRRVVRMVQEALAVPIPDVLTAAWQRYEPFRKYADPKAYPPGTETEVPLAEHTARSLLEPEVDVMVAGTVVATLRFQAEVKATLEGAVVLIRDGRFRSIRPGECAVQVELRFEGHTLAKAGPEKERIPGVLELDPPVAIEPFGEDPYAPPDG